MTREAGSEGEQCLLGDQYQNTKSHYIVNRFHENQSYTEGGKRKHSPHSQPIQRACITYNAIKKSGDPKNCTRGRNRICFIGA